MATRSSVHRVKPTDAVIDLGDGERLNVVFDANAITPAWIAAAQRQAEDENDVYALASAIADVVVSWDLFEDDAVTPVAPSREEIGQFSFSALGSLLRQLADAAAPSRAEGNASSEPSNMPLSASTPQPQTPPNGAATSPSPTVSASPSPT